MANEINAFELTDEQLDMVAGGDGNGSVIINAIQSDTTAVNFFTENSKTYGAVFDVRNKVGQGTSIDNSVKNWLSF